MTARGDLTSAAAERGAKARIRILQRRSRLGFVGSALMRVRQLRLAQR